MEIFYLICGFVLFCFLFYVVYRAIGLFDKIMFEDVTKNEDKTKEDIERLMIELRDLETRLRKERNELLGINSISPINDRFRSFKKLKSKSKKEIVYFL